MKVILGIETSTAKVLAVEKALKNLRHDVKIFSVDGYPKKKLEIFSKRAEYNRQKFDELTRLITEFEPEVVLFINLPVKIFTPEDFGRLFVEKNFRLITFFVDPIDQDRKVLPYMKFFDSVYSYDQSDVEFLQEFSPKYMPVGYSSEYESNFDENLERPIDICFVGSLFKNRLRILEPAAKYFAETGKIFRVYSPAFETKYFWKKPIFAKKYPALSKIVTNGFVDSKTARQIYQQSKICLNIHVTNASSPNPRTFEILATGSFELMDTRKHFFEFVPSEDLATFDSVESLISRAEYFLSHESERISTAHSGWKKVVPRFRLSACMQKILEEI